MKVISHRGYWKTAEEKNQPTAFERSFKLSFGTETDVRDCCGRLVISHDPPSGNELGFDEFLTIYKQFSCDLLLALNIKSDGIQKPLLAALQQHRIDQYFVFDMSVPDLRQCIAHGLKSFTRVSDLEKVPALLDSSSGVWLDSFSEWSAEEHIERYISLGKMVCVVSPELHGRAPEPFWQRLAKLPVAKSEDLVLCTDLPEAAHSFFLAGAVN